VLDPTRPIREVDIGIADPPTRVGLSRLSSAVNVDCLSKAIGEKAHVLL